MASISHVTQLLALIGLLSGGVRAQMLYGGGMMPGAFMGGGMGFSPLFRGGFDFDDFDDDFDDDEFGENLRLTCNNNVTDHRTGRVSDAIAVTISRGFGRSPFETGLGSGFNYGHDPYGFYGLNGGRANDNGGQLKAEVQILSSGIGVASVVFTQRARVEDGCHQETLGPIHSPSRRNSGFQNMYSGYGHMGLGGGMGMGMFDDNFGLSNGDGIIKSDIKINVNLQTIYIDALEGFSSLSELAGHGVAVCADSSFGWDWEATCEGPIYMCCALKYDNQDQKINLYDDYTGTQVTYA